MYTGFFELCVAVFLFNYVTINDMNTIMKHVFASLRPGGHFVFSVPHPFMASKDDSDVFGFGSEDNAEVRKEHYFSLRDVLFKGHIGTTEGKNLMVQMKFKTIEDYILTLKAQGFELTEVREARVSPEHMSKMPEFFGNVNDAPLHMVFKVRKPVEISQNALISAPKSLDTLPKMITWSGSVCRNFEGAVGIKLPPGVKEELVSASLRCYDLDINIDNMEMGKHVTEEDFSQLKDFGDMVRNMLLRETGAALVQGLDLDEDFVKGMTQGPEREEKRARCAKLAYYFLCRHIGKNFKYLFWNITNLSCTHIFIISNRYRTC